MQNQLPSYTPSRIFFYSALAVILIAIATN